LDGVGASAGHKDTGTKVGKAVGGHVLDTYGTRYWEHANKPPQPNWAQTGGMPGGILFASGGSFVGPLVDASGNIVANDQPLGGVLGPGSAVLYPSYPAGSNIRRGAGQGRVYKRTDWFIHLRAVVTDATGGSIGAGEQEDLHDIRTGSMGDNVPPSQPASWANNPNGTPGNGGLGAAYVQLSGAGDYSRYGPWGGLPALRPDRDVGYLEFIATVTDGTTVTVTHVGGVSVTFTARAVPVGPTEFALAPQPHVNLADAINAHPTIAPLVDAVAQTHPASGEPVVRIESETVVTVANLLGVATSAPAQIRIYGTTLHALALGLRVLTGGAQILQSSLLAGGNSTIRNGAHVSTRGIVALGGSTLPAGTERKFILQAA
ncbi:MAG: hypothetical protein Q8P59_11650, partial [Dehalococcoidia bacterium]|nr:hypothetical protein [Dehalococcoidia bacterium]